MMFVSGSEGCHSRYGRAHAGAKSVVEGLRLYGVH